MSLPGMLGVGSPTLRELREELVQAVRAAGVPAHSATDPHTGPGAEVALVDAAWADSRFRAGCGDPATATYTCEIWIFGYGSSGDQADQLEAAVESVWAVLPLPWRVTRIHHDQSVTEQLVRTIEVER